MTDVFIRVFSSNELRLGFAIATVARWKMQKDVRVTVLQWNEGRNCWCWPWMSTDPHIVTIPNNPTPFAAESLRMAECMAQSDPYIISNDDCLIYGQDFVQNGLRIMDSHKDYGVISGAVTNGDQYKLDGPDVTEIHAVGGLVFLRKGLVTEFPPLEDCFWDGERDKQVKQKGFRAGYTKWCPYLHLGANFSVANPAHFIGA